MHSACRRESKSKASATTGQLHARGRKDLEEYSRNIVAWSSVEMREALIHVSIIKQLGDLDKTAWNWSAKCFIALSVHVRIPAVSDRFVSPHHCWQ